MQTQTSNTFHNAIIEAGSKDRPPMLAPGNYVQWKSRIKRYIETKPNHELIHYCLTNPPYELDDKTSKDKEIDKLMALISLSFKKIYKPTNNNLQTSSNTSRANQDNSLRINRSAGYANQRIGNVAGARETVGSTAVQKSGIQCYNCKEFGHVARECQKQKWVKDVAYHREKMLLCKQEEAGIQLNAEQADWRDDTDEDEFTWGSGGDKLISWSSKKQDCTSMSFAEAEYVSLSAYCAQVLWMRTQLIDYGFYFDKIPM
nr:retrovirus-related Pol polyprotein from transposon TNT 1-94 [Tanacetum cinerariifolium]